MYLQDELPEWDVDCEYNRDGHLTKKLRIYKDKIDHRQQSVYPDIIAHKRHSEKNYLVIECKKSNSTINDDFDMMKLKAYKSERGYRHALFIKFKIEKSPGVKTVKWLGLNHNRTKVKDSIQKSVDEDPISMLRRHCRMYLYGTSGNPEIMVNDVAQDFINFALLHLTSTMFITTDQGDPRQGIFHRILDGMDKAYLLKEVDEILDSPVEQTTLRQMIRTKRNKLATHGSLAFSSQTECVQSISFDEEALEQYENAMQRLDRAVFRLDNELKRIENSMSDDNLRRNE